VNATGLNAGVAGLVLSNVNSGYNSNIFSAAGSGGAITLCPGLPGVDPRVIAVGSVSSPPGAIYIDTPNLYLRNLAGTNAIAVTSSGIAMSSAVTGTMGGWVNYTPTVTGTGSMLPRSPSPAPQAPRRRPIIPWLRLQPRQAIHSRFTRAVITPPVMVPRRTRSQAASAIAPHKKGFLCQHLSYPRLKHFSAPPSLSRCAVLSYRFAIRYSMKLHR
jgi:hypothetical protein